MQTFLPYPDFDDCARVLDPKRLGNQFYREGLTLLRGKWSNHPASRMWYPTHCWALGKYLLACANELERRGYHYPKHVAEVQMRMSDADDNMEMPPWLGDPELHASHRANLLRKDPVHYGQFGWTEEPQEGYIWPV